MRRRKDSTPTAEWKLLLLGSMLGILVVLALLAGANIFAFVARSIVQPRFTLQRSAAEYNEWERKVAEKKRQIAELEQKKRWWSNPIGEEELARTKGNLVRPGEHTVVLMPPASPEQAEEAKVRHAGVTESNSTLRVTLLTLFTCGVAYGILLLRRRRLIRARQEVGILTPRKELLRRRKAPDGE